MLLYESMQAHIIPKTRRASSKGTSHGRSGHSTPSASPSRPSSPSSRVEQTFHLTNSSHTTPWLTLRVRSNASPSKSHPLFFDRDCVEGAVELNLSENPTTIIGVLVSVRGQVFSVGADQTPFLDISQTLWTASMGHPRDTGTQRSPFTGRLSGTYSWPFSITLPSQTIVTNGNAQQVSMPLPPSYAPKGLPSFIDYKVQVLIQRGPLRIDNTLTTSFVYLPRARAPRPSHLLESAYLNHHPILGPSLDQEGWETLSSRTISGVLFGARNASVDCILSIARPVWPSSDRRDSGSYDSTQRIYARDCPIHLHMTLRSRDTQLLDLLSPSALKIELLQQTRIRTTESTSHPHTVHKLYKTDPDVEHEDAVVVGSCWRAPSGNGVVQTAHQRHFEGEIVVRKDLKPSFFFPTLSLQYKIALSFNTAGFTGAQDQVVYSEPVTIVTDKPRGPSSHSRIQPHSA